MAVLITGGARSGKSGFAERLAMNRGTRGTYIATSQIYDEEMRERVSRHQQQREAAGFPWVTREEPLALRELLTSGELEGGDPAAATVILVDCLTLWLTNWLLKVEHEPDCEALVMRQVKELAAAVSTYSGHLLFVTNEVGDGIVPEYRLGRQFRDLAGWMNQRLAEVCDEVFLVTAGIPIELKSIAYRFGDGKAREQTGLGLPLHASDSQTPDLEKLEGQALDVQTLDSQTYDSEAFEGEAPDAEQLESEAPAAAQASVPQTLTTQTLSPQAPPPGQGR